MILNYKDFENIIKLYPYETDIDAAFRVANAKLQEWLDVSQIVYSGENYEAWYNQKEKHYDTKKAKLVCIEELPKEPCKHAPLVKENNPQIVCEHCGVELIAEWKEKK